MGAYFDRPLHWLSIPQQKRLLPLYPPSLSALLHYVAYCCTILHSTALHTQPLAMALLTIYGLPCVPCAPLVI